MGKRRRRQSAAAAAAPAEGAAAPTPAEGAAAPTPAEGAAAPAPAEGAAAPAPAGGAPTAGSRRRLVVGAASALAVLGLSIATFYVWRKPTAKPPAPAPPPQKPRPPERTVIARVGAAEITTQDLARYQAVAQLTYAVVGGKQALDALCDRMLLDLEAQERGITIAPPELSQEVLRRRLIIAATRQADATWRGLEPAAPGPGAFPGMPRPPMPAPGFARPPLSGAPGFARAPRLPMNPFDPMASGGRALEDEGLDARDLSEEVKADLLAERVKQMLVYDKIPVAKADIQSAYQAELAMRPKPPAPPKPPPGAKPPPKPDPKLEKQRLEREKTVALTRIQQRLRHERGAKAVAELVADLHKKWPVAITR
jgi:hypothetical protein